MKKIKLGDQFNLIAELRNKELENAYRTRYVDMSRGVIGVSSLIVGVVYLLAMVFDIYMARHTSTILFDVSLRGGIFLLSVEMFILSRRLQNRNALLCALLGFYFLTALSYQLILYIHRDPDFMNQAMAFLLIVFVSFLIPTRWIGNLVFGICVTVMFFAIAPIYTQAVLPYQYYSALAYFIIAIALASVYSYHLHISRRRQYIREMKLEKLSVTDRLTNIYNRQKFDHEFAHWVQMAELEGSSFSVIMFDLDEFKRLNDTMGHIVGDKVLVECVSTVSARLRGVDIFARWGGEEFVILLPNTKIAEAQMIAERLRKEIERHFISLNLPVTASFGVTQYRSGDTEDTIIHRVDVNMYSAKDGGKNKVWVDATAAY